MDGQFYKYSSALKFCRFEYREHKERYLNSEEVL